MSRLGASARSAFFLARRHLAHALDELTGRPLGTRIRRRRPVGHGPGRAGGRGCARVLGAVQVLGVAARVHRLRRVHRAGLQPGAVRGRRFHSDLWFALSWGAFPAITGCFAQDGTFRWPAVLVAPRPASLSVAQRGCPRRSESFAGTSRRRGRADAAARRDRRADRCRRAAGGPGAGAAAVSAALPLLAAGLVAARLVH